MIGQANLAGLLSHKYTIAELKPMLRERGLKVSGRKAELIERLVEADPEAMKKAVRGLRILQATEEGRGTAEQYLEEEREKRHRAERSAFQALKQRKLKAASQAVASFEAKQVFARGIGIDWANHDPSRDVMMLSVIFSGKPQIINGLDDEQLKHLRLAAGMMHLWGVSRVKKEWLPEGFSTELHLDNATAARMLVFYASHHLRLKQYRGHIKTVEILTVESSSCDACKKLAKKTYVLAEVPELPYEKCTNKMGCRCQIVSADILDLEANLRSEISSILHE